MFVHDKGHHNLKMVSALVAALALILLSLGAFTFSTAFYPSLSSQKANKIVQENRLKGTTRWQSRQLYAYLHEANRFADADAPPQGKPKAATQVTYASETVPVVGAKADTALHEDAKRSATSSGNNTVSRVAATHMTDAGGTIPAAGAWTDTTIRGYANSTSINAGSSITLYVGTTQPSYNMEIYRMGYYGGAGARLIQTVSGLPGINQPVPAPQAGTGLIEANWTPTYTLQTSSSWVSGVYLVKLIAADGSVAYILFVVRNDGATADIVFQIPINTYEAYNNWGGKSLYDYNSNGGRAYKVSFDRPFADDGSGLFFNADYNMIFWLEANGYNVTYATSIDTETNPNLLNGRKVFLTDYHDEYWAKPMRDNITNASNQGKDRRSSPPTVFTGRFASRTRPRGYQTA